MNTSKLIDENVMNCFTRLFSQGLFLLVALWAGSSPTTLADPGIQIIASKPSDISGQFNEKTIDMEVKVPGGYLRVVRGYRENTPVFNPGYSIPSVREISPLSSTDDLNEMGFISGTIGARSASGGGSASCSSGCHSANSAIASGGVNFAPGDAGGSVIGTILERNGDFYMHRDIVKEDQSGGATLKTENLSNAKSTRFLKRIVLETADGEEEVISVEWRDLAGNFMKYEEFGATEWGDRYGTTNKVVYDPSGRLERVLDHNNTVVFNYAYDTSDRVTSITDYSGRTVSYGYDDSDRLISVTDVRGKTWLYDYTNGIRRTDPDGRIVDVEVSPSGRVREIDRGGSLTRYGFTFNSATDLPNTVSETSPAGVVTTRTYDERNRLVNHTVDGVPVRRIIREDNEDGSTTETEFDENDFKVVREIDLRGNVTQITYPDDTLETFEYDLRFNFLTSFVNRDGVRDSFVYDSNGNLTEERFAVGKPEQRIVQHSYDARGNRTQTTWLGDDETATTTNTWTYDDKDNVTSFTDGEGNEERYLDFDILGNYARLVDREENTWHFSYDAAGGLMSLRDPLDQVTTLVYDNAGNQIQLDLPGAAVTEFGFDSQSRLSRVTNALGRTSSLVYDDAKQLLTLSDALGHSVLVEKNAFDKVKKITDPTGNVTSLNYSGQQLRSIDFPTFSQAVRFDINQRVESIVNQLGGADDQKIELEYDDAGNLINIDDSLGNQFSFSVDDLGQVTEIVDPIQGVTHLDYDRRGNLISVVDPAGLETRYEYSGNDQVTSETVDPEGDPSRREYDYDRNGQLKEIRPANGGRITFTYDKASQLSQFDVYPDAISQAPDKTVSFTRDDAGRLSAYSDGATSSSYTYDLLDRVISVTTDFGPFEKTFSYTYYENGWLKTYTNPEGVTYTYSYRPDGTLEGVLIPGEGLMSYSDYEWLGHKMMVLPGGSQLSVHYDELLRVSAYDFRDPASSSLASASYSYDKVNNVTSINSTRTGQSEELQFGYDSAYRLTTSASTSQNNENFSYDGVGNRLTSDTDTLYTYNSKNQLTQIMRANGSTVTYEYDSSGNRTKRTEEDTSSNTTDTHYVYNVEERLTQVLDNNQSNIASYYYDPFGLRLSKTTQAGTTYFLYNGEGLAAEYDASGNLIAEYHFGPNKPWMTDPIFRKGAAGDYYYYLNDHLGTPLQMITKSGQVVWQAQYSSFGSISETVTLQENPLRFAGQYHDKETDTHYNYFRDFDPSIGRYIQADRIGLGGGLNRYSYGYQNPIKYNDPTGRVVPAAAIAYARCVASCAAIAAATAALTGECDDSILEDCALDCLNPLNWIGGKFGIGSKGAKGPNKTGPTIGGGGTLDKLSPSERKRIQNAANRSGRDIAVVGSRVNPNKTVRPDSDYDFVIDANSKRRNNLSRSLPGGKNVREGVPNNQDIYKGPVEADKPHVIFHPE
ncbi:MAG: RHS repeat protein [Pseudomonadales bacterium]|nr:RHS repeat protein [Pseudomonadales bacterium]